MFAIYKRELKSYFRSFIGMLFIAVTLFFVGLYFTIYNLLNGVPFFTYVISDAIMLFMLSVPVLTMRVLAEERRSRTDQLILTAPVSVGGIVLGKYLALLTIFAIPTAVISVYPLIMNSFGDAPLGEAYLGVLGFFLYGMTAIAIGLLVSSLTESQVISAVLTFILLFLCYIMSSVCSMFSATGNWLTRVLSCLDMFTPFAELLNGTLNVKSVVYFLSVTMMALFLTVQSIQKRRYSVSVKTLSLGAYSTGMIAVAAVIIVVVNIVLGELPASWISVDMTAQKLYSITDQTREYVNSIQEDVTIYVLAAENSADVILAQTLQRYDDLSDYITVEYVDPNVNPRFYTQYTDGSISWDSLIVVSDKRNKIIDYNDIYATSYEYDYYTGGYSSSTTGYDGEGQITSALNFVLSDDMPKAYVTEGHGEYALSSTFAEALAKENVDYETINLVNYDGIPEDASCLIINAPVADFSREDTEKILNYLNDSGNVILVIGLAQEETPNLERILEEMGLELVEGIILEQDANNYSMTPYWILPQQSYSIYLSGIYHNYYVFTPYAQGIKIVDEEAGGFFYDIFLSTSDSAFSRVDMDILEDLEKTEGDIDGPFAIGVEAAKTLEGGVATLVAFGCDQIFTDDASSFVSGGNRMLFTNTVGSFADHEVSVSIPVKSYEVSYLTVPWSRVILIGLLTAVILPLGCLAAGFIIWFRRRRL